MLNDIERFRAVVELHVVPGLCPLDVSPYDYSASALLIERAALTTRQWLDDDGLSRRDVPTTATPHDHR